jgi:hypothetical protein
MLPFAVQESLSVPQRAILMAGLAGGISCAFPRVAVAATAIGSADFVQSPLRKDLARWAADVPKSETVEHGETRYVQGAATPDGFRVVSKGGPFIASAATFDCLEKP